jgi:hypothetical protein
MCMSSGAVGGARLQKVTAMIVSDTIREMLNDLGVTDDIDFRYLVDKHGNSRNDFGGLANKPYRVQITIAGNNVYRVNARPNAEGKYTTTLQTAYNSRNATRPKDVATLKAIRRAGGAAVYVVFA